MIMIEVSSSAYHHVRLIVSARTQLCIIQFFIIPSITLVVIMPRLNVAQEIGDHLEISLCLLQVRGM
jgi:hypothetical protein